MAWAETVILLGNVWTTHYLPEKAQGLHGTPAIYEHRHKHTPTTHSYAQTRLNTRTVHSNQTSAYSVIKVLNYVNT